MPQAAPIDKKRTDAQLLAAVAEHMKLPLILMKQHAELVKQGQEFSANVIETAADTGLLMAENYIYLQSLYGEEHELVLDPASLTSLLFDVAHRLDKIARSYNASVQLDIRGKFAPVSTHRKTLEAALTSLGLAYIEACQDDAPVTIGVHKNRWGIVAGFYSESAQVTAEMFRFARASAGQVRQIMPLTSHAPMSGCVIADALLGAMSSRLRVAKHNRLSGLATTLAPTPQLSLL